MLAGQAQAQVTIVGYSAVPAPTSPGQTFQLSVTYINCAWSAPSSWEVAFSDDATTVVGCPAAGQVFLVDGQGIDTYDSGLNGGQMGWTGPPYEIGVGTVASDSQALNSPACAAITYVHTWSLALPTNATYGGNYNLIIGGGNYDLRCGNTPQTGQEVHIPLTIQVPPATIVSVQKIAEGGQAAVGDLILYTISYDFVNSPTGGTVTDVVPNGVTIIQMGPLAPVVTAMGTGAPGSTVSWTVPGPGNTLEATGQVWALARVANGATGTINNQATLKLAGGTQPSKTSSIAPSTVGGAGSR